MSGKKSGNYEVDDKWQPRLGAELQIGCDALDRSCTEELYTLYMYKVFIEK